MTKQGYQDLTDSLQHKWWLESMATIAKNESVLTVGEARFVREMVEGYSLFQQGFKPTTRQFNWFRQIAIEVTSR